MHLKTVESVLCANCLCPLENICTVVIDMKVLLVICTLLLALQDSFPLWLP